MSANHSLEICEVPTETVFRGNDDVLGQEQVTSPVPAQGADRGVQLCSLGTPVPREPSKSSNIVIVERLPNIVRKVTVLKPLPDRQPIPPPRERNVVVKSVKLTTESYPGSWSGNKKRVKELTLKTDTENLPKQKGEHPMIQESEQTQPDIFKPVKKDTDIDGGDEKNLSALSLHDNQAKKEYVKLQMQKRKQQRIQEKFKKQEQEETKQKNLKELKDKQLRLLQRNIRRARQRQLQIQQQQELESVTASEGQCHKETREEMKPDRQHINTVMTEAKENDDINVKLKNMVVALQKELKEFGHWKNKEDEEEILSHMTSFTLRSKVTASEGHCYQESSEEMKSDNQHVDTVMAEAEENYINIKLKNMAATLQKELKEFGHLKNKEDKGETPRHMTNVTLRSKDTKGSPEQPPPRLGGFVGKFQQLKSASPQKECDNQIPLNAGNTEALSGGLSLEPVVLSLTKEDSTFHPRNSFQPYHPEKQTSSGVKKGVTKTLKEYIEATKSRHLAATKIQAAFRGFLVRKMLKMDNKIQLKNNDYVNIETVDDFLTKYHSVRTDEVEKIRSTSARHKQFRNSDPQQVDILVKKEVAKILKDMHLKISVDSKSKLESPTDIQPKVPITIKDHVKPKKNDAKKLDIMVKKEVTKTLKEFMETGKKREFAATKIQAAFRGYQARKFHNMKTKMTDKCAIFKASRTKAEDTVPPNGMAISVTRDTKSQDGDRYLKAAEFPPPSLTVDDPLSEWLRPSYVEPCPYNMMTAIQNTIFSKSGPRQPYWVQANHEHIKEQSETQQRNVTLELGLALPVIDASKEKTRKQPTDTQLIHKEYDSYITTDDESMRYEDGLSVNSSALEAEHHSSSDESRVRWKKRLNVKSPQEVLPSRVEPVHWSKSDSEIIIRPSFSMKNCEKINMGRNMRSFSSAGRPAVMPKKFRYRHYGLIAPNVELRRKNERITAIRANSSCQAENSGSDTWDSHTVQRQHVDQVPSSSGIVHKAYRKGNNSSRDISAFRHTDKRQDDRILHTEQLYTNSGNKPKENIKDFQNKMRSDVKDEDEEKTDAHLDKPSRPDVTHGRGIADIIETGRMLHPSALHLQFQAEMNRLDSVEESRQRLTEIEAIIAQNMQTKQESERKQQAHWNVKTFREEKQVQTKSTIQIPKSDVQTQVPDRGHQLVQLMPKDQVQVDPSSHTETLNVNEPLPLSQPHILIQVVSSSHPQVRPVYSVLNSQNETVPKALSAQTPMKHDSSLQRPNLTHKQVLFKDQVEGTDIQDPANQVPIAGTSNDILKTVPSHVIVEQLLQEAEYTGRIVTLENNVTDEARVGRREHLMKELNVKYEKCDIKHEEFMKRIEREDNEQLSRILQRKFTPTSSQSIESVPTPQINEPTNQIKDIRSELATDYKRLNHHAAVIVEQDSNASESLLQAQQKFVNVNYKRGSEIPVEALASIGKEVADLERTVADNIGDITPEQSFQTISEGISEEDVSVVKTRNKEVQDISFSQTSSFSEVFINEVDHIDKISRIRESLHKIDRLIHEEKESAQKHVDLLNEKFKLLKEKTRSDMKLLLVEMREHRKKGKEHLVPALKKKQLSLLHNLEQARQQSRSEYDKLLKATVRRKLALRQQKTLIKSYLKSVQLRGRNFQEDHGSTSELNGENLKMSSASPMKEVSMPYLEEEMLEMVPKSESLEFSVASLPYTAAAVDHMISSYDTNIIATDTSPKQVYSENSEEKFYTFEKATDSLPQTEAGTELSDLENRVRSLRQQLHKKKTEAEKLWKEQQRKKKEQLRMKEQSLLKQIKAYDAYIDEIKKELEDKVEYSADMSLPSEKLGIHGCNEHDSGSVGDSTVLSSRKKFFNQKQDKHKNSGNSELNSGSDSLPLSTSALKKMNQGHKILSDDTNASLQLKETSQVLTDESQIENSKAGTVPCSSISSLVKESSLEDEKGLEEISEELEQSEIVSVLEEDIQEEEERYSELNSIVHNQNSGTTINELLYEKPESEAVIQELIVSNQQSSVEEIESAEEVESIPEEVTEHITEVEEHRDQSETFKQDLQDARLQSGSLLDHSVEGAFIPNVSSLKNSVEFGTCSVLQCEESGNVKEDVLQIEEEIENIPETEEGISHSEENILKVEESGSLNVVSAFAGILFQEGFPETESNCDVNKVKEKSDEEMSEKVEKITAAIFQKLINESLKTLCKKNTKYNNYILEQFNRNGGQSLRIEEVGKDAGLIDQTVIKNCENYKFMSTDKLNKQNEDKNVDKVDNITNAILEQLLIESSAFIYSKKFKTDGPGNIHEDSASACYEEAIIRDDVIAGPPDRSGINIRKRVNEILAETSGCLSTTKEKTRPQDFMITTYDVLSPEETPLPGSPVKEGLDKTAAAVSQNLEAQEKVELDLTGGELEGPDTEWFDEDYGLSNTRREAEELRLQQLQIEQEIQELEQAQEQVPYFYIREIPNKPPPPYTPPGQTTRSPVVPCKLDLTSEEEVHFIPFTAEEITALTVTMTSYLYNLQETVGDVENAELPSELHEDNNTTDLSDIKTSSRIIFKKLVFDLVKDMVKEAYGWTRETPSAPWEWPAFSYKRSKLLPRSKEMLQDAVLKQVLVLFGFAPKTYKEKLVIRWSRKKRDYVDEILMKESHEEESAWTNYDEDEVTVKNEITLGILDSLLDETVQVILDIRKTKLNKS